MMATSADFSDYLSELNDIEKNKDLAQHLSDDNEVPKTPDGKINRRSV